MEVESILDEKMNIEDLVLPSDLLDHDNQKAIETSSSIKIMEEETLEPFGKDDQNYNDNQKSPEVDKCKNKIPRNMQ